MSEPVYLYIGIDQKSHSIKYFTLSSHELSVHALRNGSKPDRSSYLYLFMQGDSRLLREVVNKNHCVALMESDELDFWITVSDIAAWPGIIHDIRQHYIYGLKLDDPGDLVVKDYVLIVD